MKRLTALVLALLMMLCAFSAVAEESPSKENSTVVIGEPNKTIATPDGSTAATTEETAGTTDTTGSTTSTNATAQSTNQTVVADAFETPITFGLADVEEGSELANQLDEDLANKIEAFGEGVTEEALNTVYSPETVAKLAGKVLEYVDTFVMAAKVPGAAIIGDQKVTAKTLVTFDMSKLYKVVATLWTNGEGAEVILDAEADEEGALVMVIPEADAKAMADAVVVVCDVFEVK
ncbi:MAG: hypothetical protein IJ246_02645 [Clostridia bacterium]|nr:hypothetical protein [Clostridia bacterium]